MTAYSLGCFADPGVRQGLRAVVSRDRETTAEMLAYLGEFEARRLDAAEGCPSMHAYCVTALRMAEEVAFKRLQAARAARRFPAILPALAAGRLHLSAVVLLAPHLTAGNAEELLHAAVHQTCAAIRLRLAERFPQPDVPTDLRPVPAAPGVPQLDTNPVLLTTAGRNDLPAPVSSPGHPDPPGAGCELPPVAAPAPSADPSYTSVVPLAPQRFELRGTMDQEAHDDLRAVQALLGPAAGGHDVMAVLARALRVLRQQLERRRFAATERPGRRRSRGDGRSVPADVKRAVWRRDGGRCTFVGPHGRRCAARARLEFDHVVPVARGGDSTPANLRLRCRAHNQLEAGRAFGAASVAARRAGARARRAGGTSGPARPVRLPPAAAAVDEARARRARDEAMASLAPRAGAAGPVGAA